MNLSLLGAIVCLFGGATIVGLSFTGVDFSSIFSFGMFEP